MPGETIAEPEEESTDPLVQTECSASTISVRMMRNQLRQALSATQAPAEVVADVTLAASELLTNALEAQSSRVALRVWMAEDEVEVEVADDAGAFEFGGSPYLANRDELRGRGLLIVSRLSDQFSISQRDGWTCARAKMRLRAQD